MQTLVDTYLAARRSMGVDLRIEGRQLRAFARFADQTGHRGPLTVDVAVRWAQSARHGTRLTWARRLQTLRPFMKYRAQFDPGTEIAPSGLFGPVHRRLVPHIYTEAEVSALIDAAAQLRPVTGLRLRARTYTTLFGLLASTGLRISEALALTPIDVDLPAASRTVRKTTFRKSRLVPLHPTTVAALQRYVAAAAGASVIGGSRRSWCPSRGHPWAIAWCITRSRRSAPDSGGSGAATMPCHASTTYGTRSSAAPWCAGINSSRASIT